MAGEAILVDAGPLVALLSKRDAAHKLCAATTAQLAGPLFTTWIVMGEAAWLLRDTHQGLERLLRLLTRNVISCSGLGEEAAAWMAESAKRYAHGHHSGHNLCRQATLAVVPFTLFIRHHAHHAITTSIPRPLKPPRSAW